MSGLFSNIIGVSERTYSKSDDHKKTESRHKSCGHKLSRIKSAISHKGSQNGRRSLKCNHLIKRLTLYLRLIFKYELYLKSSNNCADLLMSDMRLYFD